MDEIESLLEQNKIINTILNDLKNNSKVMIHLGGISGSGKTYIAKRIVEQWESFIPDSTFYMKGDDFYSNRDYYPINVGLSDRKEQLLTNKSTLKSAIELAKGIPYAGDFVGYLLTNLSEKKTKRIILNYPYLSKTELDIIFKLQYLIEDKDLLVVADNFHWFDKASIDFCDLIYSDKLSDDFSFLKRIKLLFITTENQNASYLEHVKTFFVKNTAIKYSIKSIDFERYKKILSILGLNAKLSNDIYRLLFSFTGSHIELIKNIVSFLKGSSSQGIEYIAKNIKESSYYAEEILSIRLKSLGMSGDQIKDLLEQASIVGLNFSLEELECLTKTEKYRIVSILENAKEINLIEGWKDKFQFTHEILKTIFTCKVLDKKSMYHNSFANCLRILRPSDYTSRANNLFEAGALEKSISLYIVGYFRCLRNGIQFSPVYMNRINSFSEKNIKDYLEKMKEAYEAYNQKRYEQAIFILKKMEENYPKLLVIEKDYLLSICLSKMPGQQDRFEAKILLESWFNIKNEEGEMWTRLMSTLMIIYIHLEFFEEAKKIEKKLMVYLAERQKLDPVALDGINILRRKSQSLHSSDVATERTLKSTEYFGPKENSTCPMNPIEYYMSLSNHAGNKLNQGDFDNSYYTSLIALNLIESYPTLNFPRHEIPSNNFIVSGILSSKIDIQEGIKLYKKLLEGEKTYADYMLLVNNLSILYALTNNFIKAEETIDSAIDFIKKGNCIDTYYEYYIEINRLTFKYLQKKQFNILLEWENLKNKIPQIPDSIFLLRRHELLGKYFNNEKKGIVENWLDKILIEHPFELGKAWNFFGKGYLFSDLQFWSES